MNYKNFLYSFIKNSTNQKQVELNVKFQKHFNKNNLDKALERVDQSAPIIPPRA